MTIEIVVVDMFLMSRDLTLVTRSKCYMTLGGILPWQVTTLSSLEASGLMELKI